MERYLLSSGLTRRILHVLMFALSLGGVLLALSIGSGALLVGSGEEKLLLIALLTLALVSLFASIEYARVARILGDIGEAAAERLVTDNKHAILERHVGRDVLTQQNNQEDADLEGESADLSVLVCSIKGFTSWSKDRSATEVVSELNAMLSELSGAILEAQGTLDKYTDDGLSAFWGAPLTLERHAETAVRAGLNMQSRIMTLNDQRERQGHDPFQLSIVVHSGSAVVGGVGGQIRRDYTALGEVVRATARYTQSLSSGNFTGVFVSASTRDLLDEGLREKTLPLASEASEQLSELWHLAHNTDQRVIEVLASGAGS